MPPKIKPPRSRRMTLGGVPSNIVPPSVAALGSNNNNNATSAASSATKPKRPPAPRTRRSMIPQVGRGRENTLTLHPPQSPSVMSSATLASRTRRQSMSSTTAGALPPPSPSVMSSTAASRNTRRQSMSSTTSLAAPPPSPSIMASTAASRSRRQSVSSAMAASSAPAAPPPQTFIQDTRPINDKAFQEKSMQKILSYLQKNSYPHQISTKALQRLSGTDFVRVMTFLLQQFDPLFQSPLNGNMKFEDEVVLYYKFFGYPFTLSKTSIVTAGSPHAWPGLLAMLVWLVEHYECMAQQPKIDYLRQKPEPNSMDELEFHTERAFYQYVFESYKAYMTDDEDNLKEVQKALVQCFDHGDELFRLEWEAKVDLNASVAENIQNLKQDLLQLDSMAKKREGYANDLEGYQDLIRQLNEHKALLQKKLADSARTLEEAKSKLQEMQAEMKECKTKVQTQSMTVQEELKLQSESKGLSEAIERIQKRKAFVAAEIAKEEKECAELENRLEVYLTNFQAKLTELEDKLPPTMKAATKKIAQWKKLTVHDLRNDEPILPEIKVVYAKGKTVLEKHLKGLYDWHKDVLDQLQKSELQLQETTAKRKTLEEKTAMLQSVLETETATHQAKLAVREKENAVVLNKIASLEDPVLLEEQIAAVERQCSHLEAMRIQHGQDNVELKTRVETQICEAVDFMLQHDQLFDEKVQEVNDYRQRKVDSFAGTVQVPANVMNLLDGNNKKKGDAKN